MTSKNNPVKKPFFSPLFYNWISYGGVWLAFFVFLAECFLFIIDAYAHGKNLYLGLLTYIFLPPFLLLGLFLIPIGALIKRHRVKHGKTTLEPQPLVINPSIPAHRHAIFVFMGGTMILIVMSLVGAYKGFHYTESIQFCGVLCHQVMHPEYTTYLKSPHGKVKCIECHVGAGAERYFQSKMAGVRQIYKITTQSFERPIKTPVETLRPAEETCKQCHWPGKSFGTMDFKRTYYLTENNDAPWRIRMLMNVGGGDHQSYGVHAHMNADRDIYYAAEDVRRQNITWVKSVDKKGQEIIYTTPKSRWKDSAPPQEAIRKMDCIDCHNRPTHQFVAPYRLLNDAMQYGDVDPSLPQIKEKALSLMAKKYQTNEEGASEIEKGLKEFYEKKHPELYQNERPKIDQAIQNIVSLYKKNVFPSMKVRWDTNPDNIGHLIAPGCFRCHDGEHSAKDKTLISKNCNSCHLIVEQGLVGKTEKNIDGLDFIHPGGGEDWKEASCTDCHSGA